MQLYLKVIIMDKNKLEQLVNYITDQGIKAIKDNTAENNFEIDYLGIFSRNDSEYQELTDFVCGLGKELDPGRTKTGLTFLLDKSMQTSAGELKYLKIRKPDPTRPQRGAPDFKVGNYVEFKEKYLKNGNFSLVVRKNFEMLELKGVDVLVYFPNKLAGER